MARSSSAARAGRSVAAGRAAATSRLFVSMARTLRERRPRVIGVGFELPTQPAGGGAPRRITPGDDDGRARWAYRSRGVKLRELPPISRPGEGPPRALRV